MIILTKSPDSIQVTGHAGYAPPGFDIVCAGVSALVMTLIRALPVLTDGSPPYVVKNGDFSINIKHLSRDQKILVDAFLIGINLLAEDYPDHVQCVTTLKARDDKH